MVRVSAAEDVRVIFRSLHKPADGTPIGFARLGERYDTGGSGPWEAHAVNGTSSTGGEGTTSQLDTSEAHSARVWNYLLGGKDNFAADRESAENVLAVMPVMGRVARAGRAFL